MNLLKHHLSFGTVFFVNLVFAYKYAARISIEFGILFTVLYAIVLSVFYFLRERIFLKPVICHTVLSTYLLILFIGLFFIDKHALNVDRWEMIEIFIDSICQGKDPYSICSSSGNYPASSPFYFLFFAPFHFLGEIAVATLLILAGAYMYYFKLKTNHLLFLCIIISSIPIVWEVLTRSTIMVNSYLILFILLHILNFTKFNRFNLLVSGIVAGLLLSTRTVFAFVFVIWGIYALRQKYAFGKLVMFGAIVLLSFVATFIPFVVLWSDTFFQINPFTIQSSLLYDFLLPVTIVISVIFGFLCKRNADVVFYAGVFLFAIPLLEFLVNIKQSGLAESFLNSDFDISYLLFCFPFFIHAMIVPEKRFLRKKHYRTV